jgi:VIT1/CCC1 family predicted Fe2+/Mn2+ transporter
MEHHLRKLAVKAQRNETTEALVYDRLARHCKDPKNAAVLRSIADAERGHAAYWASVTGVEVQPHRFRIFWTQVLAAVLGLTFVLKRMEQREGTGSKAYEKLDEAFPGAKKISQDEAEHEKALLATLDEERLQYVGSIVLGLNDALVELTGSLAGFTLALADTKIISLAGLITGISAAFSMAASDYLSSKAEGDKTAAKSALYTGVAYFITVILLILPFLLLQDKFVALGITLATVIVIIAAFNYYLAVAKDLNFKHRFLEMAGISLGVAAFSFFLGFALKIFLGVDA